MKQLINYSKFLFFVFMFTIVFKSKVAAQDNSKMQSYYKTIQNEHTKISSQNAIKIDKNSVCAAFCNSGYVVNSLIANTNYSNIDSGLDVLFTEINIQKDMKAFVPNGFYKVKLYKKDNRWFGDFVDLKGKIIKTLQATDDSQLLNPKLLKIKPSVRYSEGTLRIDFGSVVIVIGIEIE